MEDLELYTVNVFQAPDKRDQNSDEQKPHDNMSFIEAFPNMMSARVIKGRMLELEHFNLAGPSVKFKTVVNYERKLDPGTYLGIVFTPQDGFVGNSVE